MARTQVNVVNKPMEWARRYSLLKFRRRGVGAPGPVECSKFPSKSKNNFQGAPDVKTLTLI